MTPLPEITLYTVPNCADCEAIKQLLTRQQVPFTVKNVREDPAALAEIQRRADVRIAPVTVIGALVFFGPFDEQRPQLLSALAAWGVGG